jgi:hypothetical protein
MKMNGPGPKSLYIKKLADKMLKEKAGKILIGAKVVDAKVSQEENAAKESTWLPKFIDENRKDMRGPTSNAPLSMRQKMIEDGLFIEKDGDLMPTAKYQKLKKIAGGLSKYGIK